MRRKFSYLVLIIMRFYFILLCEIDRSYVLLYFHASFSIRQLTHWTTLNHITFSPRKDLEMTFKRPLKSLINLLVCLSLEPELEAFILFNSFVQCMSWRIKKNQDSRSISSAKHTLHKFFCTQPSNTIKNGLRTIWSPYKMIAYKMNFVHNDRLRTVQDDIQTVKIDIQ